MNHRRSGAAALVAILFLVPAGLVAADQVRGHPCDFNGDGRVSPAEWDRCLEWGYDRHPCDFDGDGRVTDDERRACAHVFEVHPCDVDGDGHVSDEEWQRCAEIHQRTTEDPDRTERHPCDFDGDGRVSEEERRRCHEQEDRHPCDYDGDGLVSQEEWRRCRAEQMHHPCDLDGDGTISEEEAFRCRQEFGTHLRADCRQALTELEAAARQFKASADAAWHEFLEAQRADAEAFAAQSHTEEEWRAFRQAQDDRRRAMEATQRAEIADFEARHERLVMECQGMETRDRLGLDAGSCRPTDAEYAHFRAHIEDRQAAFEEELRVLGGRFADYQARQREAFAARDASSEDQAAFQRHQAQERAAFEQDLQEQLLRHRQGLERAWDEFKDRHRARCLQDQVAPQAHGAAREATLRCQLGHQDRLDAFVAQHGRDRTHWTEATHAAYRDLAASLEAAFQACERQAQDAWRQAWDRQHTARIDRLGQFTVTETGPGHRHVEGRYLAFDVEIGSLRLSDVRIGGVQIVDTFWAPHTMGTPVVSGATLVLGGNATDAACNEARGDPCSSQFALRIHDNPTGLLTVRCATGADGFLEGFPGTCRLRLPQHATPTPRGDGAWTLRLADGALAHLTVEGPHRWDGNHSLELQGALQLHRPADNHVFRDTANRHRAAINEGLDDGHVVAEVNLVRDGAQARRDVTPSPRDPASPEVRVERQGLKLLITFGAERPEGGVFVFNMDPALFDRLTGLGLDLRLTYHEVRPDGTTVRVPIEEARSLADAMRPEPGRVKYWTEGGSDAVQVTVGVPEFSLKRLEVEPALSDLRGIPALGVLMAVGAVAAAAVLARRGRDAT